MGVCLHITQIQLLGYHELILYIQHLQNYAEQALENDLDYHRLKTIPDLENLQS